MTLREYSRLSTMLLAALGALLTGCSYRTVSQEEIASSPHLLAISEAFNETVSSAKADPDLHWRSGWFGNTLTNFFGGDNKGLCYHWQEIVYLGVAPTVREVGWQASGVAINEKTRHEHHVIIVFDPALHNLDGLLAERSGWESIYVLDAWERGRPDIFTLPNWLDVQWDVKPLQLEDMEAELAGSDQPWARER